MQASLQEARIAVYIEKVKGEQKQDVERAFVNRGKLQLRPQYQVLGVRESDWFTMTSEQRKKHLNKVQSIAVSNLHDREKKHLV